MRIVVFAILALALSLKSCMFQGCEVLSLSDEEMEWFDCYDLNDTVVFINREIEKEYSYLVTTKEYFLENCSKFRSNFQNQSFDIILKPIFNDFILIGDISIGFQTNYDINNLKEFRVMSLRYSTYDQIEKIINDSLFMEPISVSIDVLTVNRKSPEDYYGDDFVQSFKWSKEYGLVEFTIDDKVYEFLELRK